MVHRGIAFSGHLRLRAGTVSGAAAKPTIHQEAAVPLPPAELWPRRNRNTRPKRGTERYVDGVSVRFAFDGDGLPGLSGVRLSAEKRVPARMPRAKMGEPLDVSSASIGSPAATMRLRRGSAWVATWCRRRCGLASSTFESRWFVASRYEKQSVPPRRVYGVTWPGSSKRRCRRRLSEMLRAVKTSAKALREVMPENSGMRPLPLFRFNTGKN